MSANSVAAVLKNLPFVLFLAFLVLIYIANAHYSERKVRQIQGMKKELKELRWEYMALKSELTFNSRKSQVSRAVEPQGLEPPKGRPKKIVVKRND